MAEELNDARDGVGAIQGALGAVDDFELVNVVKGLIGEVEEAAGLVEGRAGDEELGEGRIAAVEEKWREAAFAAGAGEGGAGEIDQRIGEQDELALADVSRRAR